MTISLKEGVKMRAVSPTVAIALLVANSVYADHGIEDLVVTSVCEGHHSPKSKHYIGNAFDVRIWDIKKETLDKIVRDMRKALGSEFDVVLESDHIHVEYDPKSA